MPSRRAVPPNGTLTVSNGNSNSLGNDYADMLIGNLNCFQPEFV